MTTAASVLGEEHARRLDAADPLARYRDRFLLPTAPDGTPRVYLAGQSLGAQPVSARAAVEAELDAWARLGVDGWFAAKDGWLDADGAIREPTATLVGARVGEIATMNTLTVNLHLLLATFFRPAGGRTAILIDAPTFPSDRYAVESQLRLHGLDPARDLIVVRPRDGEALLRTEDLEGAVHEHRDRPSRGAAGRRELRDGAGARDRAPHYGDPRCRCRRPVGPGARRGKRSARAPRRGRRWRRLVHVQIPQRRPGIDRPGVPPRAARVRRFRDAADRLVGQRPGDTLSDGRDIRTGARSRRLADLDATDPVAGAHPRLAGHLR